VLSLWLLLLVSELRIMSQVRQQKLLLQCLGFPCQF
jgi:hypothetical protein